MRRVIEPYEPLERRFDPLEVLLGQDGGDVSVVAAEHEKNGHFEARVALAKIQPGEFVLQPLQGKAIAPAELDEIDQICFVGAQRGPDQLAGGES